MVYKVLIRSLGVFSIELVLPFKLAPVLGRTKLRLCLHFLCESQFLYSTIIVLFWISMILNYTKFHNDVFQLCPWERDEWNRHSRAGEKCKGPSFSPRTLNWQSLSRGIRTQRVVCKTALQQWPLWKPVDFNCATFYFVQNIKYTTFHLDAPLKYVTTMTTEGFWFWLYILFSLLQIYHATLHFGLLNTYFE